MYHFLSKGTHNAPLGRDNTDDIPDGVLKLWEKRAWSVDVSEIKYYKGRTESKIKCILKGWNKDWTHCQVGDDNCPGECIDLDGNHEEQRKCVKCRRWVHPGCDNENDARDVVYYKCNAC